MMADLAAPFSETMAVLCADQMQRWDQGDEVQVEHYLHRFPQLHGNQGFQRLPIVYGQSMGSSLFGLRLMFIVKTTFIDPITLAMISL